jgi:stage II sporulation SpoAA-like protein
MIERIEGLPAGIDGVRCNGKLTRADYDAVVVPLLEEVQREHRRMRCLVEVDGFDGITPTAAFEDVRLGLRALGSFDGCAVVSDLAWVGQVLRLAGFLLPYPVRIFPRDRREDAITWLRGLPAGPAITHRVLTDAGVVVVEVTEPLRVQDVEALAMVVDGWLAEHPTLHGLVLHASAFPGWENVGGLVRHLRFVIGHHRHVDRVALAVDGPLATAAATVAELVAHPQVRRFTFDELNAAIAWASTP